MTSKELAYLYKVEPQANSVTFWVPYNNAQKHNALTLRVYSHFLSFTFISLVGTVASVVAVSSHVLGRSTRSRGPSRRLSSSLSCSCSSIYGAVVIVVDNSYALALAGWRFLLIACWLGRVWHHRVITLNTSFNDTIYLGIVHSTLNNLMSRVVQDDGWWRNLKPSHLFTFNHMFASTSNCLAIRPPLSI